MDSIGIGLVQMRSEKGAMNLNLDATERAIRDARRHGDLGRRGSIGDVPGRTVEWETILHVAEP